MHSDRSHISRAELKVPKDMISKAIPAIIRKVTAAPRTCIFEVRENYPHLSTCPCNYTYPLYLGTRSLCHLPIYPTSPLVACRQLSLHSRRPIKQKALLSAGGGAQPATGGDSAGSTRVAIGFRTPPSRQGDLAHPARWNRTRGLQNCCGGER